MSNNPISTLGQLGDILASIGTGMQASPHLFMKVIGNELNTVGTAFSALANAAQTDQDLVPIVAQVLGGIAGGPAALAIAFSIPEVALALGLVAGFNPLVAGIVVGSIFYLGMKIGGNGLPLLYELGQWLTSQLTQPLRDPLVLDLDGDGVELTPLEGSSVYFDYDEDGFAERTGWVSADDGILVLDANGNSEVDGAGELFGSPTKDGFEVLETYDSNGDGVISVLDEVFEDLRVWRDLDADGASDVGELFSLSDLGIVEIELTRSDVVQSNNGHEVGYQASYHRDAGPSGIAQTVYFQTSRQETSDPTPTFTPAEDVDKLPYLPRSGQLLSFIYVLSEDVGFHEDWLNFTDEIDGKSPGVLRAEFEALLLRWAAVDQIDSLSRGPFVDARHLAFVEKYFGETFIEVRGPDVSSTNPGTAAQGRAVEENFNQISLLFLTLFLSQVALSNFLRSEDDATAAMTTAINSPYFAYALLDYRTEPDVPPPTPGNLQAAVEVILAQMPDEFSGAIDYFEKALVGLEGMIYVAFDGSRESFADFITPLFSEIDDLLIRRFAVELATGAAREGTINNDGLVGDSTDNVFFGGVGNDGMDGRAGDDLYVYRKGDGQDWLSDSGGATDVDTLILTDLESDDISLTRIANDLLITITETGHVVEVNDFFKGWGTQSYGIEQIRFADDTIWDRADIQANTIFTGNPGSTSISDSSLNDVIQGTSANNYITIGAGSDTILFGTGDGSDIIDGTSDSLSEHDQLVLTDLTPADVQFARVGNALVITVIATGETVTSIDFFVGSSALISGSPETSEWDSHAWGIESISFANGEVWSRERIQLEAHMRGTAAADTLIGSGLDDTFIGGSGDDNFSTFFSASANLNSGNDTYVWSKGDGNDLIQDASGSLTEVDTLVLTDVNPNDIGLAYHGNTLLITIKSTGEVIQVADFFYQADNLHLDANNHGRGIDRIQFANGAIWNRETIYRKTGEQFVGKDADYSVDDGEDFVIAFDEFGHLRYLEGPVIVTGRHDTAVYGTENDGSTPNVNEWYTPDTIDFRLPMYGNNYADGYGGNDTIYGGAGHDVLFGNDGDDILWGDGGDGPAGHDILDGGTGNDELHGGAGLDRLSGGDGNDILNGGAGRDYLYGGHGNDTITGGLGDDYIQDDQDSDTYVWTTGDGDDVLAASNYDYAGTDVLNLVGLDPEDVMLTRRGADLIVTVTASGETFTVERQFYSDSSNFHYGVEIIRFDDNTEWNKTKIQQEAWFRGTATHDDINPSTIDDTVVAGLGNDIIRDTAGSDTFLYASGDGDDFFDADNYNRSGTDTLWLTDLNAADVELSRFGDYLLIRVPATDETITVKSQFYGFPDPWYKFGIEQLKFADGTVWDKTQIQQNAWYRGTNVQDIISTSTLAETIYAGQGNDIIYEWTGSDTYVYASGDGNDIIHEGTNPYAGTDTLHLIDMVPADVELARSGDDLIIKVLATNEQITFKKQYFGNVFDPWYTFGIENIRFADGTLWNEATVTYWMTAGSRFYAGTSGADTIIGSHYDQFLSGGNGHDIIDGKTGSDDLEGGLGNDTLIISEANIGDIDNLDGMGGTDTASFAGFTGAVRVDLVEQDGIAETSDATDLTTGPLRRIGNIRGIENVSGTAFDDHLAGDGAANVLTGGDGDDLLEGRSGNDTLLGGAGADTLVGALGNDLLEGGEDGDTYVFGEGSDQDTLQELSAGSGTDEVVFGSTLAPSDVKFYKRGNDLEIWVIGTSNQLTIKDQFLTSGSPRVESFRFANGTTYTAAVVAALATTGYDDVTHLGTMANNTLNGTTGNDVFAGLGGNDTYNSAVGSDTFVYGRGEGNDIINEESASTSEIDTLRLTDLLPSDIVLSHVGNDLMIKVLATGHQIEVDQHFWSTTQNYGVERITFADSTVWDHARINAEAWYRGTSGAETITGSAFNDTLHGAGANDTINGAAGSDIYIYAAGDGNDKIDEGNGSTADVDVLRFLDLNPGDITLTRVGTDLMIDIASTGARIEIDEHFYSTTANWGVERLEFADSTVWTHAKINSETWYRGTSSGETITGSAFNDNIDGAGGNDTLSGSTGDDTIVGGGGNDSLTGGSGNDAFVFKASFGLDTVQDFKDTATENDILEFSTSVFADYAAAFAASAQVGADVVMTLDAQNVITLKNTTLANLGADDFRFVA